MLALKRLCKFNVIRSTDFEIITCLPCTSHKTGNNLTNERYFGSKIYNKNNLDVIDEEIQKGRKTNIKWSDMKTKLKSNRGITDENIDSVILDYMTKTDYIEYGKDYIKHLEQNGKSLNVGAIGKLLKLYSFSDAQHKLTGEDQSRIVQFYRSLVEKYKCLDRVTSEYCIAALVLTKEWKESIDVLNKLKVYSTPPPSTYSSIISAAFKNNDPEIGWQLLQEMSENNRKPLKDVFAHWIDYNVNSVDKNKKDDLLGKFEKMFYYCADNDILIHSSVADKFVEIFPKLLNWNAEYVTLSKRGECLHCKNRLQKIDVFPEEFQELQETFYNKVVVGKNIFIKSSPSEIKDFLNFLDQTAPYDLVVDGLNLLYSIPKMKSASLLVSVIKKLKENNKKILLLGRKHLNQLPRKCVDYLNKNCFVFLTDDLSYDDTFLLYAALKSSHTKFMSRDLMRGHKYLLKDPKHCAIFKKWQQKSQIALKHMDTNGNIFLKESLNFLPQAQKSIGWHIPYTEDSSYILPDDLEPPKKWICLRPQS